jgi:hypothetical protein
MMLLKKMVRRLLLSVVVGALAYWAVGVGVIRDKVNDLVVVAWQATGDAVAAGDLGALHEQVAQSGDNLDSARSLRAELTRKWQDLKARRDDEAACTTDDAALKQLAALLGQRGNCVVIDGRIYERAQLEAEANRLVRMDLAAGDAIAEMDAGLTTIAGLIAEVDRQIQQLEEIHRTRKDRLTVLESAEMCARIRRQLAGVSDPFRWDVRCERVDRILFGPAPEGIRKPAATFGAEQFSHSASSAQENHE